MLLALKIAIRYLCARKSHSAVNVISVISVAGVAVATTAIVVIMSVFNGFTRLAESHLSRIDPELLVVPTQGKVIANADSLTEQIVATVAGVASAVPSLTERALLEARTLGGTVQMPVVLKGVGEGYERVVSIDSVIIDGAYTASSAAASPAMQVAVGLAISSGMRPDGLSQAILYVPKRVGRINPAYPASAYRSAAFDISGVMRVDQPEYDSDRVIVPLDEARRLLDYDDGEATAIEVALLPGTDAARAAKAIEEMVGGVEVLGRTEQQAEAFRMISVEKWMTFLMLAFVLLIASFNIVSSLSLLIIEKRDNMATLRALGAPRRLVRRVFMAEGAVITMAGGIIGAVLGSALSLLQEHFGIIGLSGDPSTLSIDTYPVELHWGDVALVIVLVAVVAAAASAVTLLIKKEETTR